MTIQSKFNGLIFMAANIEDLRARAQSLLAEAEEIVALADKDDRDLTEEELADIEAKKSEVENLNRQITARESVKITSKGRKTTAEPSNRVPAQPRTDTNNFGFANFGEFAQAVRNHAIGRDMDARLRNAAPSTSANEGVGADGGFLVAPDFRQSIWEKVVGEESLFSRVDQLVTSSNHAVIPADEGEPWDNSNGIRVFWENELAQINQSKPVFDQKAIRLNKMTALVPVSEESLEDVPMLDGYLRRKAPQKMGAALNTAIVRGTGVGQPLGILNAKSLITVGAESGQSEDTVLYMNVVNMWSRMYAPCRRNAVWLINQDVEPQLFNLAFRESATSPVPAYMPAGGLSSSPFATLMGRPVIPVEACSTLGDAGDVILVDLSQYLGLTKGTNIQTDVSMHLFFDVAAMAYRFIFRVTGMPWWASAVSPQHGDVTRGWAIVLEDRD